MKKKTDKLPEQVGEKYEKNKGGRPRVADDLKKVKKSYSLHFTEKERLKIEKAFQKEKKKHVHKLSRNAFIIDCVLSVIDNTPKKEMEAVAVLIPESKLSNDLARSVNMSGYELNIIGKNLNQLVKRTHFLSMTSKKKKEIVQEIEDMLQELNKLAKKNFSLTGAFLFVV